MRSHQELAKRLSAYSGPQTIWTDHGYLTWQMSTGENVEILFIEAERGFGKELLQKLCEAVRPFHSIFVVRLASNEIAGKFYRKWGFKEYCVPGLYRGVDAMMGVVEYQTLCKNLVR